MGASVNNVQQNLTQASQEANFLNREPSSPELKPRGEKALRSLNERKGYEVSIFTPESAANYENDARNNNLRLMYAYSAPKYLIDCYRRLANAYPEIRNVKLCQNYEREASDLNVSSNGDMLEHQVFYNFSDPDCYRSVEENFENDRFAASYLDLGMRLGLDPAEIAQNAKLCATFIFARELGRARYFELNFFEPHLRALELTSENHDEALAESLPMALRDWAVARKGELAKRKKYNSRSNRIASAFAANYIAKHRDDFIYDMRKGQVANGRVQDFGNTSLAIPIPDKLVRFASPKEGIRVQLNSCDADGNIQGVYFAKARLDRVLMIGEPLYLNSSPDANPYHGEVFKPIKKICGASYLPNRNSAGKVHNDIVIRDEKDNYYLLQDTQGELKFTEVPFGESREFLSKMNQKLGQRIIMSRQSLSGASRAETAGQIALNGEIHGEFVLGGRLSFSPDKTARIKRVLRRWREYYIETENDNGTKSIYEISDDKD